jgi:hypothetical protein
MFGNKADIRTSPDDPVHPELTANLRLAVEVVKFLRDKRGIETP